MSETFGADSAGGHLLDVVVADGGRGAQGLIDIAGLEQAPLTG